MKRLSIKEGDRFGKLVFIKEQQALRIPSGQVNRIVLCRCDCGKEKIVRLLHLVRGRTLSCGCASKTRGGKSKLPLGIIWRAIKSRCKDSYFQSEYYSKKGITICKEWENDIDAFFEWATSSGYREGLVIDRIDNSKGYSPDNCRWVTQAENNLNKDNTLIVEYNGKKQPLFSLLREIKSNNSYNTVFARIKRGWEIERAIHQPTKK